MGESIGESREESIEEKRKESGGESRQQRGERGELITPPGRECRHPRESYLRRCATSV
jgi:hypothetical protein